MRGAEPIDRLEDAAYSEAASEAVYQRLLDKARPILRAGHAVIIDAGFREPPQREAAEHAASNAGVAFLGLWLEAGAEQIIARVEQRRNDASDADADVVRQQIHTGNGAPASWARINGSGSVEDTLAQARALYHISRR